MAKEYDPSPREEIRVHLSKHFGLGWKAVCKADGTTEWADSRHQVKKALARHMRTEHPNAEVKYV